MFSSRIARIKDRADLSFVDLDRRLKKAKRALERKRRRLSVKLFLKLVRAAGGCLGIDRR